MRYVRSLTNVLSDHLGWHRARLKFIARFTAALLMQTTTNLKRLALTLKAGVEPAANYRRIQRFLKRYDTGRAALGRLLLHIVPVSPPYVLTVDRTEWHFGQAAVNVLVVGVVFGEVAVPVAQAALPTAGGSGADDQTGLLEAMLHVVDPASVEALVADREFISTAWLRRLQAEGIPFAIRLRSDRRGAPSPDASALPARLFARVAPTGRERVLRRVRLNTGRPENGASKNGASKNGASKNGARRPLQPVDLVMKRVGPSQAEDPFVILAVWGAEAARAMELYRQRWSANGGASRRFLRP